MISVLKTILYKQSGCVRGHSLIAAYASSCIYIIGLESYTKSTLFDYNSKFSNGECAAIVSCLQRLQAQVACGMVFVESNILCYWVVADVLKLPVAIYLLPFFPVCADGNAIFCYCAGCLYIVDGNV